MARCTGTVLEGGKPRRCKLPARTGTARCHLHSPEAPSARPAGITDQPAGAFGAGRPGQPGGPSDVTDLPADARRWNTLVAYVADTAGLPDPQAMAEKDLYVTRVIKEAVAQSSLFPEIQVLFKGGTSLSKAYTLLNRFSEDIDVNIVPPASFGAAKKRKARKAA